MLYHCAFNFPAVLLTLGPTAWPELKPAYEQLVRNPKVKIRRTLSFSLFELAKVLGPQLAESELVSFLFHFMKDVNEVKEGVLDSLPDFIETLSPEQRETYIDQLAGAWKENQEHWRNRSQTAEQIGKMANLLSAEIFSKYFETLFFELCEDQVAEVRITATQQTLKVLDLFYQQDKDLFDSFVAKMKVFKTHRKFNIRQTFIQMCESVLLGESRNQVIIFIESLLDDFVDLQTDRIVNVRIQLSETLSRLFEKHENLVQIEMTIGEVLERMSPRKDSNVNR